MQYRAVLENPDGAIRHGQFAHVEMPVAELNHALLISRKAVMADQDRRFVYVVDQHNRVVPRHVKTGRQIEDLLVINEGLESGERVIVNGVQKVFGPGVEVRPKHIAMRAPARDSGAVAIAQELSR